MAKCVIDINGHIYRVDNKTAHDGVRSERYLYVSKTAYEEQQRREKRSSPDPPFVESA